MKSVVYHDYHVFEDGVVINLKTDREISVRVRENRKEIRLTIDGCRKTYIVSRLVYWLFNPDFDIDNKNLCVVADDMINFTLSDLKVVERKDLIQGEKHKAIAKLSDTEIEEIKALYQGKTGANQYDKKGMSYQDLADKYKVTKALIAQIIRGECRNEEQYKLK